MSENSIAPIIALALSIVLFGFTHLLPSLPRLKTRVKAALGRAYLPLFILTSVLSVGMIGFFWAKSPFIALYDPPTWGPHATFLLMFFAFLLFGVFLYPCRLKQKLRTPFALVVLLWGAGHLLANGDVATVVMAGGLMVVAIIMLVLAWRNDATPQERGDPMLDYAALLTGAILYLAMVTFHEALIGVPVLTYIMPG